MLDRRRLLLTLGALAAAPGPGAVIYPDVLPRSLRFPVDHGAHPDFRTEWWYLTGWLGPADRPLGFQVTFFRARTDVDPENPSAFAATQLVIGHVALADPGNGRLLVDERIARAGFGVVAAGEGDTDVRLDGWSFARNPATGRYRARIDAPEFGLQFTATPVGAPWLQGEAGVSRKGPLPERASYYYSQPRLAVSATLTRNGRTEPLTGTGWLDHEWSSAALAPEAAGWDWLGMNLDDGSALLAFQIRARAPGGQVLQRYAAFRRPDGTTEVVDPAGVRFTPMTNWRSPRSGATWPVVQRVEVGKRVFETAPLMADQELDSRLTTGAVYWEGASTLLENSEPVGRGYLELTGYLKPLTL